MQFVELACLLGVHRGSDRAPHHATGSQAVSVFDILGGHFSVMRFSTTMVTQRVSRSHVFLSTIAYPIPAAEL
ncbi:hypothetical protein WJX73_005203 [Symbiochloris irregularis]|uniref:Uncharacterized protein n=1 Tax=Symbiochloris irregularis TaxID=706552 RepID=A0AAW1NU55_9CHLO